MRPGLDFMADFILATQIASIKSRYTTVQIELKYHLAPLHHVFVYVLLDQNHQV